MNQYDQEYYFITDTNAEEIPFPSPDANTVNRRFNYEEQPPGSPPFGFNNGAKELQKRSGVKVMQRPPLIMINGSNPMVPLKVRNKLLEKHIPGLFTHHSYYIHDDGEWYEDYWYLAFGQRFDCWDRQNSTYNPEPLEIGGMSLYSIYTYSLNAKLLEKTPLQDRLLFQMGSCQEASFVCHQSIAHLFVTDEKLQGVTLVKVADY